MTLPNLIFWISFFGIAAAFILFTSISTLLHPIAFVLAASAVAVVHEYA